MGYSYGPVGVTAAESAPWVTRPADFRAYERSVRLGSGGQLWESVRAEVLDWGVKTRSGFAVKRTRAGRMEAGDDVWLRARAGFVSITEPVRIVAVIDEADRCGFSYGTLDGHPVSGEEAFIAERRDDASVWLTLRSVTRPGRGKWRLMFPAVLVAQQVYRYRYLRALVPPKAVISRG